MHREVSSRRTSKMGPPDDSPSPLALAISVTQAWTASSFRSSASHRMTVSTGSCSGNLRRTRSRIRSRSSMLRRSARKRRCSGRLTSRRRETMCDSRRFSPACILIASTSESCAGRTLSRNARNFSGGSICFITCPRTLNAKDASAPRTIARASSSNRDARPPEASRGSGASSSATRPWRRDRTPGPRASSCTAARRGQSRAYE